MCQPRMCYLEPWQKHPSGGIHGMRTQGQVSMGWAQNNKQNRILQMVALLVALLGNRPHVATC